MKISKVGGPRIPAMPRWVAANNVRFYNFKERILVRTKASFYGSHPATGMATISRFFQTFAKLTESCNIDSYHVKRISMNPVRYDIEVVLRYKHEPRHLKAKNVPEEV